MTCRRDGQDLYGQILVMNRRPRTITRSRLNCSILDPPVGPLLGLGQLSVSLCILPLRRLKGSILDPPVGLLGIGQLLTS